MGLVALIVILPAAAQQSPSATRSFSSTSVAAGADVTVTIAVANYGGFGRISETLPEGFAYKSSNLDDSQVNASGGQMVQFTLQGETSFTYIVTASSTAGSHSFSGELRDSDRNNHTVGGPSNVTVQAPPTGASPSATRAFSSTSLAAGADVTVTIAVANYGGFGRVSETLPSGFAYTSSSLDDSQVNAGGGQTVQFTLQGETSFTYIVTASSTAGSYSFSGELRDSDRNNHTVGGPSSVTVQAPPAGASPSATRSFSSTSVAAGADVTVTIAVASYGGFGRVSETLPAGFTYTSSSLDDSQVDASGGQTVRFTLQGESSFTYTVTASSTAGSHSFSGELRDSDRNNHTVVGPSRVTVQVPAGPASRSFSPSQVTPNGTVTVGITAAGYGGFGRVTENLPSVFTYESSSLDDSQVDASGGQTVRFTLQGETSFTYTVTAPGSTGTYTFRGTFRDSDRVDTAIGGAANVRVRAASTGGGGGGFGGGASTSQSPRFREGTEATRSVPENAEGGTLVGDRIGAFDNDSTTITYGLAGEDARIFVVNPQTGQLSVGTGADLDFEAKPTYSVTVQATDEARNQATITVTVTVTNVDEAGVVTLSPAAPVVGVMLTASLYEPDGNVTSVVWQWDRSLDQSTWLAAPGDGWTYTPAEADAGHYLRATVSYSDVHGTNRSAQAVTVNSVPLQPAPTATATAMPPAPTATATAVPPAPTVTATAVPPAPTATATAVPPAPTATATAVPPAPTATATAVPAPTVAPIIVTPTPEPPTPTATVAVEAEEGGFPVWAGVLLILAGLVVFGVVAFYFLSRR